MKRLEAGGWLVAMDEALVEIQRRVDLARALNDEREEINRARRLALESRELDVAEALADVRPAPPSALVVLAGCASAAIRDDFAETPERETLHHDAGDPKNIGKRVKVWWDGERRWFSGVVVDTSPERGAAKVLYDDKDVKWEKDIVFMRSYARKTSDRKTPIVKGKRLRTPPIKLGVNDGWGSAVVRSWSSH